MKIFRRKREAKPLAPLQEKTAFRIAETILRAQRRIADLLNEHGQKLGMTKVKIILGTLLLAFAFYCGYLVFAAIF